MNKYTYLLIALAGILICSCYEDKGNYDYNEDIKDVPVTLMKTYGVKKEKEKFSYTIVPEINVEDHYKKNLSYEWYVNTEGANSKGELIGTDETLTIEIDPNQEDMPYTYYIRLYVTDNLTKAVNMQPSKLEIIKPYTFSWMVLHETDGHAEIGSVEYMGGSVLVTPDAYTKDKGSSLAGKPLKLSCRQIATYESSWKYEAQSQFYLTTTNEEESGLLNPANNFEMRGKWTEILHPTQREAYFDPNNIIFYGGDPGAIMTSKGRVFLSTSYSPVMYLMSKGDDISGDYYISKLAGGPQAGVGFDETGHRFLNISMQNADIWTELTYAAEPGDAGPITMIPRNENNAIDPGKIPEDQKIVAFVNGYHYGKSGIAPWQRYTIYAYTIAGSRSYVYVFQCRGLTGTDPALPNYYEFTTPDGIDENTLMTSGNSFSNVLFYAVGNKIYKLDVSSGNSTLIYQHDNPEAWISDLKMACEGYSFNDDQDEVGTEDYGVPYNRCLGVAFNLPDGTGEMTVLQLGTNGRILEDQTKYPSIQIHRGFGPIKSIVFI